MSNFSPGRRGNEAVIAQRIEVERRRDSDRDDRSAAKRAGKDAADASRAAAKAAVPEGKPVPAGAK